jgi:hypothetical protein
VFDLDGLRATAVVPPEARPREKPAPLLLLLHGGRRQMGDAPDAPLHADG